MSRDILADAARRWAHALPGHVLLAAEPSAIPVSAVTVDVLAEQVEEIDAALKYALRAIMHGIDTVDDLQLFLGLDEGDTKGVVAGLLHAEFIDYRQPPEGGDRRLSLQALGQEAARNATIRRPKPATIPVVYDRLTNRLTEWRKPSLRRSAQAKSDPGRILMPPATSMPIQLEDLSITAVSTALRANSDAFRILGVSGLTENRNYYYDAILLVYKDIDSNTLRLGVEVDGVWSEEHTAALEAIGAVQRLGLTAAPVEEPHEPVGHPGKRLTRDEVIALQTSMVDQDQSDPEALSRSAIRWLGVYEHPKRLDDALTNSQRRLLIISPWITQSVVDAQWVSRVEKLARTVDVTIFWGFGDNRKTDTTAIDALHTAAQRSQRLAIVKVDDTHAKVLVGDDFYIKTSFNWLSFRGDPSRKYRQEEGDLVQDQVLADGAYAKYMTDNLAHALEVVGTLPAQYRTGVRPGATTRAARVPPAHHAARPATTTAPAKAAPDRTPVTRSSVTSSRTKAALRKLAVGQTLSGPIKNITDFGAFVDLGDFDGLIHKTRLGKRRVEHPSEVVTIGQTVSVMVVEVDVDRGRVSLALNTL